MQLAAQGSKSALETVRPHLIDEERDGVGEAGLAPNWATTLSFSCENQLLPVEC